MARLRDKAGPVSLQSVRELLAPLQKQNWKIGLVRSLWNGDITQALYAAAVEVLQQLDIPEQQCITAEVPGSFEIPLACNWLIQYHGCDAVIALGCVIKGQTRHDEYIAHSVSQGLMQLNIQYSVPVIFGVLTVDDVEQAWARAGGSHGNKGAEAALAALHMLALREKVRPCK